MKLTWTLVLLAFAGGCGGATSPPLRFQVVDAETRLVLAGVKAQQENLQPRVIFGSNKVEYINYPPTGPDGLVVTRPLPAEHEIIIMFSRDGYLNSEALTGGGEHVNVDGPILPGPRVGRSGVNVPRSGLITVPLYRAGGAQTTRDSTGRAGSPATPSDSRP